MAGINILQSLCKFTSLIISSLYVQDKNCSASVYRTLQDWAPIIYTDMSNPNRLLVVRMLSRCERIAKGLVRGKIFDPIVLIGSLLLSKSEFLSEITAAKNETLRAMSEIKAAQNETLSAKNETLSAKNETLSVKDEAMSEIKAAKNETFLEIKAAKNLEVVFEKERGERKAEAIKLTAQLLEATNRLDIRGALEYCRSKIVEDLVKNDQLSKDVPNKLKLTHDVVFLKLAGDENFKKVLNLICESE